MNYVRLGSTGTTVSELCFGTWRFGHESDGVAEVTRKQAYELLDVAYERGVNFFDTSNNYGGGRSKRYIGEWLADRDREDIVLASKMFYTAESRFDCNLSRKTIRAETEGTLDQLGTEYIDVYYIHRFDDGTPIEETLRTLNHLAREGKVNYLGASINRVRNGAGRKLVESLWTSDANGLESFTVTQPKVNTVHRESELEFLNICEIEELAMCPYEPLEGGFLTGKYDRDERLSGSRGDLNDLADDRFDDRQWRVLDEVRAVAEEADATPAQVTLRWLIEQDWFICVKLVGARTPDQLRENLSAAEISLSSDQHNRITEAY